MLHARPKSFFSPDYRIEQDGRDVATLDLSAWRERGTLEIAEGSFSLTREGLLSGEFRLEGGGRTVARGTKRSAFTSDFDLRIDGAPYRLRRRSVFGRAFDLEQGGRVIGSLRPKGIMSRTVDIDLPSDWSLAARLFVVWLVLLMWRRDNTSSA